MGWDIKATADTLGEAVSGIKRYFAGTPTPAAVPQAQPASPSPIFAATDGLAVHAAPLAAPLAAPAAAVPAAQAQATAATPVAGFDHTIDLIGAHWMTFAGITVAVTIFLVLASILYRVRGRIAEAVIRLVSTNWRLALLGTTGIVLSLASGWTTWDGMWNFTCATASAGDKATQCFGAGVLSLMITFGIQGVMLIVAWLIGESFATGMSHTPQRGKSQHGFGPGTQAAIGSLIGVFLFIALVTLFFQSTGEIDVRSPAMTGMQWSKLGDKLLIVVVALLLASLVALYSASDVVKPYLQSSRVILKNAVLWVMFLACMGTSVFFSFDSLFSTIFPQSERVRAAELRAQNQVGGVVADIGHNIGDKRLNEASALFAKEQWTAYDAGLSQLAKAAEGSGTEIEAYFNGKLEDRNRAIKQQQERIATSVSSQAGLAAKKISLTDELSRLEAERPGLAAEFAEKKSALDTRSKEIDAKRVEAMAEDKGVEGTGKVGRGPVYRQRSDELNKLQDYYKIGEERVKDARKRLDSTENRITAIKRELAGIDGELAKYKGESETASQRIKLTEAAAPGDSDRIDPARVLPAFETARAAFREEPTAEHLAQLQQYCGQLYNAMNQTEVTKSKVHSLDCDPKQAADAAALVFALNDGSKAFKEHCEGGDKLEANKGADALFGFARKCLADSGLPSAETARLRDKINAIELNRDDKAHRFVVTWNAFQDGNRLAYLSLAIAIALDGLVFMSGLFGANAVRSPLSDVPGDKARTAQHLEAIVENALLPDTFETARLVLNAMRPMTPSDGFVARVGIRDGDPHANDIRRVLNAGSTIGAVRHIEGRAEVYEVRSELFEFLSIIAKRAFHANKDHANLNELEKILTVALMPVDTIGHNARVVLDHIHPMTEDRGFIAKVHLDDVTEPAGKRVVRNALNAGATLKVVQRIQTDSASYYIHGDFYKSLLRISAQSFAGRYGPQREPEDRPLLQGGALGPGGTPRLAEDASPRQLTALDQPRSDPAADDPDAGPPAAWAGQSGERRDDSTRRDFLDDLIRALNIDPEAFEQLTGAAFGAAAAAASAFDTVKSRNQLLDQHLTERDQRKRQTLDEAFKRIEDRLAPSDATGRSLLRDAYEDVDQNWPVLMLMPNGPFEGMLQEIVHDYEPDFGAGRLDPREKALFLAARNLLQTLEKSPRQSELNWQNLEANLSRAPTPAPGQQLPLDNGKPTLN